MGRRNSKSQIVVVATLAVFLLLAATKAQLPPRQESARSMSSYDRQPQHLRPLHSPVLLVDPGSDRGRVFRGGVEAQGERISSLGSF